MRLFQESGQAVPELRNTGSIKSPLMCLKGVNIPCQKVNYLTLMISFGYTVHNMNKSWSPDISMSVALFCMGKFITQPVRFIKCNGDKNRQGHYRPCLFLYFASDEYFDIKLSAILPKPIMMMMIEAQYGYFVGIVTVPFQPVYLFIT